MGTSRSSQNGYWEVHVQFKAIPFLLLFPALLALAFYQTPSLTPSDFTPAAECGKCHQEIYNQWSQSMHSRSFTDPVYRAVLDRVLEKNQGRTKAFCLSCHAPVASVTGQTVGQPVPLEWDRFGPLAREGVTCDFCHTISGNEMRGRNIAVGAYVYPRRGETKVKYGRYQAPPNEAHTSERSDFLTSSEVCAICHQFKHPVSLNETQNTYQEWLDSPYPDRGVRCQDCHMPAYSGATAKDGPVRERVHAHTFLDGRGAMLGRAASLTVWGVARDGRLEVNASVRNSGAGHTIPTGVPGIRRIQLEVRVLAPGGEVLARRDFYFGQRPLTTAGELAFPWDEFERIEDTRIGPEESALSTFSLDLPNRVGPEVRLEARLWMHRLTPELAGALELPTQDPLLMTTAEATVSN